MDQVKAATKILSTCFLLLSLLLPSNCQQVPIVNTTSGLLRGFSPYPGVHAYLGIPFAEPPIGDLRFTPPQPFKASNATVDCYDVTPGCFQLNYITAFSDRSTGTAESEDMLSINVVCPSQKPFHELHLTRPSGSQQSRTRRFQS